MTKDGWLHITLALTASAAIAEFTNGCTGLPNWIELNGPTVSDLSLTTRANISASGQLPATDPYGNSVIYQILTQPSKGTISLSNMTTGTFVYTPNFGINGADSFTFNANNGIAFSNTGTVSISITCVSPPPNIVSWWGGNDIHLPSIFDVVSSSGNTGTVSGAVSAVPGEVGNALSFSGSGEVINFPASSSLDFTNSMSILGWVFPNTSARTSNRPQTLFSRWNQPSTLSNPSQWSQIDITTLGSLGYNYTGFYGGVFDGRYVYFAPNASSTASPYATRYDTQGGGLSSSTSWQGVNLATVLGETYKGFLGAVFDGRYVYYVPNNNGAADGYVARYDTQAGSFTSIGSWTGLNLATVLGQSYVGFTGGIFDGRYVYFVPDKNGTSGYLARYDTHGAFSSSSSWLGINLATLVTANAKGFNGAVSDGHYIYFISGIAAPSGVTLRYDPTVGDITQSAAWLSANTTALLGANYQGFEGGTFDGRYIYLTPYSNNGKVSDGYIARYDTTGSFNSATSWTGVNIAGTAVFNSSNYTGFTGAVFDGRFVYFIPFSSTYQTPGGTSHIARYDTLGSFASSSSWTGVNIAEISGMTKLVGGYDGAVWDGRYIYLIPNDDPTGVTSGKVARYDTGGTDSAYSFLYSTPPYSDGFGSSLLGPVLTLGTTNGSMSVASQQEVTTGKWHHLAGTYDGSNLNIYIDGALAATSPGTGGAIQSSTAIETLGGSAMGTSYYSGLLSEFQVYSSALSADQIQSIYSAGASGLCH